MLHGPINWALSWYFDSIDEDMIFKSASLTKGARGPLQDSEQYLHILNSRKFRNENKGLREQIAQLVIVYCI